MYAVTKLIALKIPSAKFLDISGKFLKTAVMKLAVMKFA